MLLRMLEEGMPVDIILFCDTGVEFDGMYRHIEKLEQYIGRPITRLKASESFEYYFYEYTPKPSLCQMVYRRLLCIDFFEVI